MRYHISRVLHGLTTQHSENILRFQNCAMGFLYEGVCLIVTDGKTNFDTKVWFNKALFCSLLRKTYIQFIPSLWYSLFYWGTLNPVLGAVYNLHIFFIRIEGLTLTLRWITVITKRWIFAFFMFNVAIHELVLWVSWIDTPYHLFSFIQCITRYKKTWLTRISLSLLSSITNPPIVTRRSLVVWLICILLAVI